MNHANQFALFCGGCGGTLLFGFSGAGRAIWCSRFVRLVVNRSALRLSPARRMRSTEVDFKAALDEMASRNRQWDINGLSHSSGGRDDAALPTR